jgi:hypothetical protein
VPQSDKAPPAASQSASSQTTAAKFARDLGRLLLHHRTLHGAEGGSPLRGAVLVLDHAERLLTLPRVGSAEQPNYLAQLLFIPRYLGANVTFLAITTSHLLHHSRTCQTISNRILLSGPISLY